MNFDNSLKQGKKPPRRIDVSSPSNFQPQPYKTIKKSNDNIYSGQSIPNPPTMPLSKLLDHHRTINYDGAKTKTQGLQNRQFGDYHSQDGREQHNISRSDAQFTNQEEQGVIYRQGGLYTNSTRNEPQAQVFNSFHVQKNNNSTRLIDRSKLGSEREQPQQQRFDGRPNNSNERNKMLNKLEFFREKPQSMNVNTSRTDNKARNVPGEQGEKPAIDLKRFCIDDFEIGIKLGKGKFGDVFLAREKKTDFIVALKVLNKAEIQRLNAEKLVVREIKIHSFLDHRNIIKLYGFFHDDENIYLILEYAPDGELYKELKATPNNRFTEEKTSKIIRQVLDAFIYLQSLDIIHRDLKPENLLSFMGQVKLADFGWSVCAPDKKRKTFCGTIDYMPPEMAHGTQYDFKTDNWAIGVLCYEFLVGKAPFETKSRGLTLDGIKKGEIVYPSFLSDEAKDFINRLLVTDPQVRMELVQAMQHPFIRKFNKE